MPSTNGSFPARSEPGPVVVIATRNRAGRAAESARRALALPEVSRVVVVDDASTDGTAATLAREAPGAEVVVLPTRRGAAARNVGVRRAASRYVAFCDDDAWWEPGALRRATAVLDRHPDVAVLAPRVLVEPGGKVDPTCDAMTRAPRAATLPGPPVVGFLACAAVVRTGAFLASGGFPLEVGIGGEEAWVATELRRRGWELCYDDALVAHHAPERRARGGARGRSATRNDLLLAMTTRPARALGHRLVGLANGPFAAATLGAVDALRALPWVLAHRRPLPATAEHRIARIEAEVVHGRASTRRMTASGSTG